MTYIGEDIELIERIQKEYTLLSGKVDSVSIVTDDAGVKIEIMCSIIYSKGTQAIKLVFKEVEEFAFYQAKNTSSYIVYYKLINSDGTFYISLDPFDESSEISPNDNDFIKCKSIEGYVH